MRISYGMNAYNSIQYPDPRTRRLSQVTSVSQRVLLGDLAYEYNHPPLQYLEAKNVGYKHDKKANLIFFDGHGAPRSLTQTNNLLLRFD
jgi:prepilin-type processing-associated H-X9-DG protein